MRGFISKLRGSRVQKLTPHTLPAGSRYAPLGYFPATSKHSRRRSRKDTTMEDMIALLLRVVVRVTLVTQSVTHRQASDVAFSAQHTSNQSEVSSDKRGLVPRILASGKSLEPWRAKSSRAVEGLVEKVHMWPCDGLVACAGCTRPLTL